MKKLKYVGFGVLAALLLVFGVLFTLSSEFNVERTVIVNAPKDKVFAQVSDLKNFTLWSPWKRKFGDDMQLTFGDVVDEEGGWYSWEGKESGKGKMIMTRKSPSDSVVYDLMFEGMSPARVVFRVEEDGKGSKVTWGMSGDVGGNPLSKVFAVMMDRMVGPDFEAGLGFLKETCEQE